MGIEIRAIGGYQEIGRNMTAVKVDDEVVLFDMGLHMPNYIEYTSEDREDLISLNEEDLRAANAIPDDRIIKDWKKKVIAIVPSHAHLDHIGAIPFAAPKYDAPIISTPLCTSVLRRMFEDEKTPGANKLIALNPDTVMPISKKLSIEFINITHSILQTVVVALHTPYGVVVYGNDFKMDDTPVLGKRPSYERLEELARKGVVAAVVDCLNCTHHPKTPSESVARELLREVMLEQDNQGKAIIVTTFSSNLERLYSVVEFARKLNRKPVFMGRSLSKYAESGQEVGLVDFEAMGAEMVKYGRNIKRRLAEIQAEGTHKFVLVVTGHQGEPKATLAKMANRMLPFAFKQGDHVIFASRVIPTPVNIADRRRLEMQLERYRVKMFKDVHTSGHGGQEDMRQMLDLIKPRMIIPSHGEPRMIDGLVQLTKEMGISDKVNIIANGDLVMVPLRE